MIRKLSTQDEVTEFLLYTAPGGKVRVEVLLNNETLWLTQKRMSELFGVGVPAISKHLRNIFECGELDENTVISILETTAPDGKNYLSEQEIKRLERTVSSFFDYIERIIERRNTFTMEAFSNSVNKFLEFNEYQILEGYGKISRQQAELKALKEYEKFSKSQYIESDFDRETKKLIEKLENEYGNGDE